MDKKMREEMYEVVGEAIREVIGPDIQEIREDVKDLKNNFERLERKVDANMECGDRHGKKLEELDGTVSTLESPKS